MNIREIRLECLKIAAQQNPGCSVPEMLMAAAQKYIDWITGGKARKAK